jgi:hypothetical protein
MCFGGAGSPDPPFTFQRENWLCIESGRFFARGPALQKPGGDGDAGAEKVAEVNALSAHAGEIVGGDLIEAEPPWHLLNPPGRSRLLGW